MIAIATELAKHCETGAVWLIETTFYNDIGVVRAGTAAVHDCTRLD